MPLRVGASIPLLSPDASDWNGSRLCENAALFRFRGSSDPSALENNRIQLILRGRIFARSLLDEFSHSLGRLPTSVVGQPRSSGLGAQIFYKPPLAFCEGVV